MSESFILAIKLLFILLFIAAIAVTVFFSLTPLAEYLKEAFTFKWLIYHT